MSDRGILFLLSLVIVIAGLCAAVWLFASGQVGTVDGLFLLCSSLVLVFAFGIYLRFLVRSALAGARGRVAPAGNAGVAAGQKAGSKAA